MGTTTKCGSRACNWLGFNATATAHVRLLAVVRCTRVYADSVHACELITRHAVLKLRCAETMVVLCGLKALVL